MRFTLILVFLSVWLSAATPAKQKPTPKHPHHVDREHAHVTNGHAFKNGAGSRSSANVKDGNGGGVDKYIYYSGAASEFPNHKEWVSFEDMWNNYKPWLHHFCKTHKWGPNNTPKQIKILWDAIQSIAQASQVDHRFILAVVMQESGGCVWVPTTANGVENPGLMQSHGGVSFNPKDERKSIFRMVKDGTQGTPHGDGLVQGINQGGDIYTAARIYNSGSVAPNGDLSNGNGATPCYVSDIANRLTGWVNADSRCGGYFPVPILNLTVEDSSYRRRAIRHTAYLQHSQDYPSSPEGGKT